MAAGALKDNDLTGNDRGAWSIADDVEATRDPCAEQGMTRDLLR